MLTGLNGAGKTSILEALSLLSPGRGLRRASFDEIALRQAEGPSDQWAVAARLATPSGLVDVSTGHTGESDHPHRQRRQVRIDGQPAKNQAALAETLGIVWLTPEMDRLFLEGASGRRRFFDRLVFGIDPGHASRVSAYERAMQQRSKLLREGTGDESWLAALERVMAANGVAIAASRLDLAGRLNRAALEVADTFPKVRLEAAGTVEEWLGDRPALTAEEHLQAALAAGRPADAASGGANVGPHRSDMQVFHAITGRTASTCSTGEQKTLLIAIILASVRVQADARGALPLVLLDEVAAHLDARHRCALFEAVAAIDVQAWYAGTDRSVFDPLRGRVQFYSVENGGAHASGDGNGGEAGGPAANRL